MAQIVEVVLWGTTIGFLGYAPGQNKLASFEYDKKFVNSGIEISPTKLPLSQPINSFPEISVKTFKGIPGVFADSLPDKFGNQLIDIFMAQKGISPQDVTTLDRLLYIGTRGMGAIEYQPADPLIDLDQDNIALDIHTLAELAEIVVAHKHNYQQALLDADKAKAIKLIRVGSSAGGARSKALVAMDLKGNYFDGTVNCGKDSSYWLLKFDNEDNSDRDANDPKGMTKVEYIYADFARQCKINMPNTRFIEDGEDFHYLIERFDRIQNDDKLEKLHYASWCGLAHSDRDTTGTYSYEQLILLCRQMKLGQSALTEIYKRCVFNIVGRNQDDHTKNFGFLMNKQGEWSLSPAFDLTYAYDPTGKLTQVHQIRMNGKQTDFSIEDLLVFGEYCNLTTKSATSIIERTVNVFTSWEIKAKELNISKALLNTVKKSIRVF